MTYTLIMSEDESNSDNQAKKNNVVFLNTLYNPSLTEKLIFRKLQIKLCEYNAELNYKTKSMSKYNSVVLRTSSHQRIRDSWRLIINENYKKEEQ